MLKEYTIYYFGAYTERQFYIKEETCFLNDKLSEFIQEIGHTAAFWYSADLKLANFSNLKSTTKEVYLRVLNGITLVNAQDFSERYKLVFYEE